MMMTVHQYFFLMILACNSFRYVESCTSATTQGTYNRFYFRSVLLEHALNTQKQHISYLQTEIEEKSINEVVLLSQLSTYKGRSLILEEGIESYRAENNILRKKLQVKQALALAPTIKQKMRIDVGVITDDASYLKSALMSFFRSGRDLAFILILIFEKVLLRLKVSINLNNKLMELYKSLSKFFRSFLYQKKKLEYSFEEKLDSDISIKSEHKNNLFEIPLTNTRPIKSVESSLIRQ